MPVPHKVVNITFAYGISGLLLFSGCVLSILGVIEFKKQKTTVNPMTPQESNKLVINGVYKYTRNPMYLAFLLWILSVGVFVGNFLSFPLIVGFIVYMNKFQIIPEEAILDEKFGEEYIEYKKKVRRWI